MNKKIYYPNIKDLRNLLLVDIACSLISYIVYVAITGSSKIAIGSLWESASYCIASIITIIFAKYKMKQRGIDNGTLKFKKVKADVIIISIFVACGIAILVEPVTMLIPMPEFVKKILSEIQITNALLVTAIIAAPILEEILFRGIILNGLLKKYSPTTAIILSALIFAVFHLNPWQGIIAFFLGLLVGWLYIRTQSLIACMMVHFSNNAIVSFFGETSLYTKMPAVALITISCVVIYIGIWWIDKRTDNYVPENIEEESTPTYELHSEGNRLN